MQDSPLIDINIAKVTQAWAESQNISCDFHHTLESTNTLAKNDAFNGLDAIQVYITEEQTAGRGRADRKWVSPKAGTSLLSSWSFRSAQAPSPYLTAQIGKSLLFAVRSTWPYLDFQLKAPNDLLIDTKKVAGLLVETISQGDQFRIIIGLGLNVLTSPVGLTEATHLMSALQKKKLPLLGEDWIQFLDRWLFEICLVIPEAHLELTATQKSILVSAFNHSQKSYKNFDQLEEDLWR